jgi:hypothetical protein
MVPPGRPSISSKSPESSCTGAGFPPAPTEPVPPGVLPEVPAGVLPEAAVVPGVRLPVPGLAELPLRKSVGRAGMERPPRKESTSREIVSVNMGLRVVSAAKTSPLW